jgi:phage shock protein A
VIAMSENPNQIAIQGLQGMVAEMERQRSHFGQRLSELSEQVAEVEEQIDAADKAIAGLKDGIEKLGGTP